jgi:hypothetical protein
MGFLEETKEQFLDGLRTCFGEGGDEWFSGELRVILFELWVRAHSRPSFPVPKPESQIQLDFTERLAKALDPNSACGAVR